MRAADGYRRGDIVREDSGDEFLVVADGVDNCGQIMLRKLDDPVGMTPKYRRFRKLSEREKWLRLRKAK